jgi:hypothetical protein
MFYGLQIIRTPDESLTSDPVLKAELLQSVFSAAFTEDDINKLNTIMFTPLLIKRVIIPEAKRAHDYSPRYFLNNVVTSYRRHWPFGLHI